MPPLNDPLIERHFTETLRNRVTWLRLHSPFVDQVVVFLFAQFAAEWIIKAGFYCVANEIKCFFLSVDNPATHSATDFMLIPFSFENCWAVGC
jgi:hypothetical protein